MTFSFDFIFCFRTMEVFDEQSENIMSVIKSVSIFSSEATL